MEDKHVRKGLKSILTAVILLVAAVAAIAVIMGVQLY